MNDIPIETLRAIFLKQRRKWSDGKAIIVLNFKAKNPVRVTFDRIVLKMLPEQAAAYWIDRRIRGGGHPPRSLISAHLIQRIVARNPQVISYVFADELTENVKTLKVNGHAPGTSQYPLRQEDKK